MTLAVTTPERDPFVAGLQASYDAKPQQIEDGLEKVRQLFEFDPEFEQWGRQRLAEAAETVVSTLVVPSQHVAIGALKNALEWRLFGGSRRELPEGLTRIRCSIGGHTVYNTSIISSLPYHGDLVRASGAFRDAGAEEVIDRAMVILEPRVAKTKDALTEYIKGTEEYALIASFMNQRRDKDDRPLTRFWHQVRTGQVVHDVRRRYAIAENAPITPGTQAHMELQRRVHRLDNETMVLPNPKPPKSDIDRLKSYLYPQLCDVFAKDGRTGLQGLRIEKKDGFTDARFVFYGEEERHESIYDSADKLVKQISRKVSLRTPDRDYITHDFLCSTILGTFKSGHNDSLQELLDCALSYSASALYDELIDYLTPNYFDYAKYSYEPLTEIIRQAAPGSSGDTRDIIDGHRINKRRNTLWDSVYGASLNSNDYETIMRLKNQLNGSVEKYGPNNFRVPSRLVLTEGQELGQRPPPTTGNEDLVIEWSDYSSMSHGVVPRIPGYNLVSISESHNTKFGFNVDPNGDPYAQCDVLVPHDRLQSLIDAYRRLGLDSLAQTLEDRDGLTVTQLTDAISDNAEYYVPGAPNNRARKTINENRAGRYTAELNYFSSFVDDGILQVQCSGANIFLKHSLELVFGAGTSTTLGGYTISAFDNKITSEQHLQTVFSHGGNQYILDATPSSDVDWGTTQQPPKGDLEDAERHISPNPKFDYRSNPGKSTQFTEEYMTPEQKLDALFYGLKERLRIMFDQPNDNQLYKTMLGLAPHDPARKTLESVQKYKKGIFGVAQVNEAIAYLDLCVKAESKTRNKLGINFYTGDTLDQLINTLTQLVSIPQDKLSTVLPVVRSIEDMPWPVKAN